MNKNPRTLKILQNAILSAHKRQPETTKVESSTNKYDLLSQELTVSDLLITPGTYVLQENCSLILEKAARDMCISGTPSNIILCNDGSLRKASTSSSDSVSILIDTECITNNSTNLEIIPETQGSLDDPAENIDVLSSSVDNNNSDKAITNSLPILFYTTDASEHENIQKNDSRIEGLCPTEDCCNNVEEASTSSTSGLISNHNETSVKDMTISQTRKRQKKSHVQDWSAYKNKNQREKGKPYLGKKKVNNKWTFIEPKSERKIKDRCYCKLSLKGDTKLQCDKISEEERQNCFIKFWNMTWQEKKCFVKMSSICKSKQRERCAGTTSRRENSVELYLTDSNGVRYRVCKKMFLNSLSVGEWAIKKWIILSNNERITQAPKNNTKDEPQKKLREFLESLPKLESHYCRKDSTKLYLEPTWTSKTQLYKIYRKEFCPEEKVEPLSITSFSILFEAMNLSLFRPKKDLCDTCESFKTGNITESEYETHKNKKEEARRELATDTASNNEVLTMDLQSVLLSPVSNVSSLYYKTKLITHNFTIYDVKRNKGYCYIWNESEGKLTSNEFSTIIVTALGKFICQHPFNPDQELILYSDGCTHQNRNVVLSNALLNFSMENKISITQKYLEKGHTQMECDSMHSVIERAIRHKKINVPADYVYLAKVACKKNPYEVEYLYHNFFKDVENTLTFYKTIRPGKKAGDPKVTDVRALKYVPDDGKIIYKLRHSSNVWEDFPVRFKKRCHVPWDDIPQLYSTRLKIKKEKYLDLQALKHSMEKDYHKFYDDLPFC